MTVDDQSHDWDSDGRHKKFTKIALGSLQPNQVTLQKANELRH